MEKQYSVIYEIKQVTKFYLVEVEPSETSEYPLRSHSRWGTSAYNDIPEELKQKFINKKILILKIILVSILIITALASLPFLASSGYTHFKHALEWNYFIGVILFYFLSFLFWKRDITQVHTPEGV